MVAADTMSSSNLLYTFNVICPWVEIQLAFPLHGVILARWQGDWVCE